ncbi:hypothetical protein F5887DRAFT_1075992 [Amanita rubescens]|nr:hypothetical protein F5887DRAFT_1075992 [Amanita rubescens]
MGAGAAKKCKEAAKARQLALRMSADSASRQTTAPGPESLQDAPQEMITAPTIPKRGRGRPRKQPIDSTVPAPRVVPNRASRQVNIAASTSSSSSSTSDSEKLPIETVYSGIQPTAQARNACDAADEVTDSEDDSMLSLDDVESRIDVDDGSDSDDSVLVVSKKKARTTNAGKKPQKGSGKKRAAGLGNDGDELTVFEIKIRINDVANNTCTPDKISSTISWELLQEKLLETFNVHFSGLHIQYRLSTEKKDALYCDLTSQKQLDTLIDFIRPKRGNSKLPIVDLYNKCDIRAEADGKKTKGKQKGPSSTSTSLSDRHSAAAHQSADSDKDWEKRCEIRKSLTELHHCPTHSHPSKKALCWKDQDHCYPITEGNLNLWADLHHKDPDTYSLTNIPAEIGVHRNGSRSRAPASKLGNQTWPPYANAGGYPAPMYMQYPYPLPGLPHQPIPPSTAYVNQPQANAMPAVAETEPDSYEYPPIPQWLCHCDRHPRRQNYKLGRYAPAFDREGFVCLDQLVGSQITISDLSDWLQIGRGTADLIIRCAEQDVLLIKNHKFELLGSEAT